MSGGSLERLWSKLAEFPSDMLSISKFLLVMAVLMSRMPAGDSQTLGVGPSLDLVPELPPGICVLPPDLGNQGRASLVEDCDTLDYFPDNQPPLALGFRGSTMIICCPLKRPKPFSVVVFPGEEGSEFEENDNEDSNDDDLPADYEYGDYLDYKDFFGQQDQCAFQPGTSCKDLDNCTTQDFNGDSPPTICGWSSERRQHRLCCLNSTTPADSMKKSKLRSNNLYKCEDYTPSCVRWSVGAPESCNGQDVDQVDQTTIFMSTACQLSCGHCDNDNCLDHFDACDKWTRAALCPIMPDFMSFFCRASCGTCGFNSPRNKETQIVGSRQYSDLDDSRFHCGSITKLSNVNKDNKVDNDGAVVRPRIDADLDRVVFGRTRRSPQTIVNDDGQDDSESGFFFYATEESKSKRGVRCGAVTVDDRFVVMAAHCNKRYSVPSGEETTLTILMRDDTEYRDRVAVRRIINHPGFKEPELYYDIAVIELARRIEFDFDKYGDSPACLGRSGVIAGLNGTSQGYGHTEHGTTSDNLLTTNVSIITNGQCASYARNNFTGSLSKCLRLSSDVGQGVNEGLFCSTGFRNEETDVYSGPCEGDSGGPLFINYQDDKGQVRQTVEGIVSGGFAVCGGNAPAIYTRVSAFRKWIACIIRSLRRYDNSNRARRECNRFVEKFPVDNVILTAQECLDA